MLIREACTRQACIQLGYGSVPVLVYNRDRSRTDSGRVKEHGKVPSERSWEDEQRRASHGKGQMLRQVNGTMLFLLLQLFSCFFSLFVHPPLKYYASFPFCSFCSFLPSSLSLSTMSSVFSFDNRANSWTRLFQP
jgi:hypothetical protein